MAAAGRDRAPDELPAGGTRAPVLPRRRNRRHHRAPGCAAPGGLPALRPGGIRLPGDPPRLGPTSGTTRWSGGATAGIRRVTPERLICRRRRRGTRDDAPGRRLKTPPQGQGEVGGAGRADRDSHRELPCGEAPDGRSRVRSGLCPPPWGSPPPGHVDALNLAERLEQCRLQRGQTVISRGRQPGRAAIARSGEQPREGQCAAVNHCRLGLPAVGGPRRRARAGA